MDLNILFWNSDLNHAEYRSFESQFFGHPTTKSLLESMTPSLATISSLNLTQQSMDGLKCELVTS